MRKSRKLLTFETFAQMFLDFGKEFNTTQVDNTAVSIEIQTEEFKLLWRKVRNALKPLP